MWLTRIGFFFYFRCTWKKKRLPLSDKQDKPMGWQRTALHKHVWFTSRVVLVACQWHMFDRKNQPALAAMLLWRYMPALLTWHFNWLETPQKKRNGTVLNAKTIHKQREMRKGKKNHQVNNNGNRSSSSNGNERRQGGNVNVKLIVLAKWPHKYYVL